MQADNSGFLQGTPLNDRDAEEEQRTALATGSDVHHIAADTRVIRRLIERGATTAPAAVVSPRGKSGQAVQPVAAALKPRDVDRIRQAVTPKGRASATAHRDASGRFVSGGGSSAATTGTLNKAVAAMARQVGTLGSTLGGVGHVDPALAAAGELRNVVSPVGRGFMALHNRLAERKKERWYSRILKAITGRKGEAVAGGGDVTRGSFLGTFMGELMGNAARMLPAILAGAGGLLLKGLGLLGAFGIGQYIGGKIYEWLDKSGIATKVFDAFDAVTQWFKDKFKAASDATRGAVKAVARIASDAQLGSDEARYGKLDAETRREARLGTRGAAPDSAAYKAGRVAGTMMRGADAAVGGIKRLLGTGAGYNVVERADGSVVKQSGARNWRNNNPGNIEFGPFAQKMGAIGSDGRFAVFPDYETGRSAKAALIFDGKKYRDLNLAEAISRYAPPTENDTGAYQRSVLASVGGANKRMADYSPAERGAILDAMQRVEGFKVGRSVGLRAATVPAVVSATMPAIKPAAVPMTAPDKPTVIQAPTVPERLGSARQAPVVISKDDVNQDVRDRRLAHIVTGGIGG